MIEKTQLERLCEQANVQLTLEPGTSKEVPVREDWPTAHRYLATLHVDEKSETFPLYAAVPENPPIADVMYCVVTEALYYMYSLDAKDFANRLGILNMDQAAKEYKTAGEIHDKLMRLLGDDFYRFLKAKH